MEAIFDANSPLYDSSHKDPMKNKYTLTVMERYINADLNAKGYVYLNQIYERLGLGWDPTWENKCILYKEGIYVSFNPVAIENGFKLTFTVTQ